MVDFTDPSLWVHVRYNKRKRQPGKSLRLYTFDRAHGLVFKEKMAPPNLELRFDDNHIIKGPNYVKLLDYLKHRSIFVNCVGRIYMMIVGNGGGAFMAQSYFPWHAYGGPPLRFDESSLEVMDLNGDRVPGALGRYDGDKKRQLRDENADLKKRFDDLTKENEDMKPVPDENARLKRDLNFWKEFHEYLKEGKKQCSSDESKPTSFFVGDDIYFFIHKVPYEDAQYRRNESLNVDFSPEQLASRDYGFTFRKEKQPLNISEGGGTYYKNVKYYDSGDGSYKIVLFLYRAQEKDTNRQFTTAMIQAYNSSIIIHVAMDRWKRIGLHMFESRPGSIWS